GENTITAVDKAGNETTKTFIIDYDKYIYTEEELHAAVLEGGNYKFGADIAITKTVTIPSGISVDMPVKYVIYYLVVIIFFFMSVFFGRRASCHYICWIAPFMVIGRKLRNLLGTPALQLEADETKCIDCKICERECPMSLPVNEMVKEQEMEQSECILCGKCADSCPKKAIKLTFGTPKK
ncbi:MAG: 4Fe-4S binding protein, partial [Lachnospiraceae bacterium]|nr:4Fe-4S binding protein [Lachnospiraceae bacterium]